MKLGRLFGDPDRDEFAAIMRKEFSAILGRPVDYDAATFTLRTESLTVNLANAYDEYLATPRRHRREAARRFARGSTAGAPEKLADVLRQVLPRVRERAFFEFLPLLNPTAAQDMAVPWEPLAQDLGACLVLDQEDSVVFVTQHMLETHGLDLRVLRERAAENLRQASKGGGMGKTPTGFFISSWHDSHDASRLLLTDYVAQLDVKGDPVAMIPNANALLVAGSEDDRAQAAMLAEARGMIEKQPRPLSGRMLRLAGGQWQPYLPPIGSVAFEPAVALRNWSVITEYTEQASVLTEHDPSRFGEQEWLPEIRELNMADEPATTLTFWIDGAQPALMPVADQVYFGIGPDAEAPTERLRVSWDTALRVCSRHLAKGTMYPERYAVSGFPDERELEELRREALPMWDID